MLGVRSNGRSPPRIPPRPDVCGRRLARHIEDMTEQDAGQQGARGRADDEAGDTGAGAARDGERSHPDTGERAQHDEAGRTGGAPYVPSGRDEAGRPQPAVPHEGLLGRIATSLVAGQSVVLIVVAVAGYVVGSGEGFAGRSEATFLALRLNPAHSTILLVWAVLGIAALARRKTLRAYAALQAAIFLILFAFGTAYSVATGDSTVLDLNTPDNILHGVLFLLGFIIMMISSARIVEPPPGPDPYPDAKEDDPSEASDRGLGQDSPATNSSGHDRTG